MTERPTHVYAAIAGNLVIACAKLIAAGVTGSAAMFTEGIHSVTDTGNQCLMLAGLRASRKKADETHPFGYGQEVYFWGFVVAMLVFSLGGGVSIYEGIRKLGSVESLSSSMWNYIVLAIAAVSEGASLSFAVSKFRKTIRPGEHWWVALRTSKDPTVFIVLAEDTAALVGIAVAAVGIALTQLYKSVVADAVAAILIGGILCTVAALLAIETKALLLGESADPEIVAEITRIVGDHPLVYEGHRPLTMHFGPDEILVNMVVEFRPGTPGQAILDSMADLEARIHRRFPRIRRIFIAAEALHRAADLQHRSMDVG